MPIRRVGIDPLSPSGALCKDSIVSAMAETAASMLGGIDIFESIDSTNSFLMRQPEPEQWQARVCLADQQTGGRGRRGRNWISPPGANLYLSMAWHTDLPVARRLVLSPLSAIAVARALRDLNLQHIGLKWPNDLYANGHKLGGILLENRDATIVTGIGINIAMANATGIDQPWTDIQTVTGQKPCRNDLAAAILSQLLPAFAEAEKKGIVALADAWAEFDVLAGQQVVMLNGERAVQGRAEGVTAQGALRLRTSSGVCCVTSGEVSVRIAS